MDNQNLYDPWPKILSQTKEVSLVENLSELTKFEWTELLRQSFLNSNKLEKIFPGTKEGNILELFIENLEKVGSRSNSHIHDSIRHLFYHFYISSDIQDEKVFKSLLLTSQVLEISHRKGLLLQFINDSRFRWITRFRAASLLPLATPDLNSLDMDIKKYPALGPIVLRLHLNYDLIDGLKLLHAHKPPAELLPMYLIGFDKMFLKAKSLEINQSGIFRRFMNEFNNQYFDLDESLQKVFLETIRKPHFDGWLTADCLRNINEDNTKFYYPMQLWA